MEITITKSDFEQALPVGAAANDSVYESVKPTLGRQLAFSNAVLLGVAGMVYLEEKGEDSPLMKWYKQFVCLSAFLIVLRQLDLVLTPTGFGVVSNDNLAPASKQRVDALEGELRTQYHKTLAMTLNLLRSENWGATEQARHFIDHLYDEYTFFFETHQNASATDWDGYQQTIEDAEEMLRTKMGDRQMDDILDAFRRADPNRLEPYREVIACIIRFTDTWAVKGAATLKQPVYRRLMRILESEDNQEYFKLYRESASYIANHHDTFKNTKDSAGYVFNG
ncbi:MAG: DUF6712 family protein [Prevotella sp.]